MDPTCKISSAMACSGLWIGLDLQYQQYPSKIQRPAAETMQDFVKTTRFSTIGNSWATTRRGNSLLCQTWGHPPCPPTSVALVANVLAKYCGKLQLLQESKHASASYVLSSPHHSAPKQENFLSNRTTPENPEV